MEHYVETYGLPLLFLLIALESAGIPLPGESALIAAAIASSTGHLPAIWWVIAVAAAAAIIGDNGGYWAGRFGLLRLVERWERSRRFARKVLPPAERFFERHGGKTVFVGRFIALLRITAAWLAGISRMEWWRFFLWNAAGGIVWATGFGLLAYYVGGAAIEAIDRYGLIGAGVLIVLVVAAFFGLRFWKRRIGLEGERA